MLDVIVIGAGVTGCATARELSRYDLKAAVLEREEDVCCGTSKANSAIIHAGYDAEPGTLKARMNVQGNRMMDALSKELDFPFKRNGSLVLCFDEDNLPGLEELRERAEANGVPDVRIVAGDDVKAVLYAPTGGIVCPFKMTIALAENSYVNGVDFHFNTEVTDITRTAEGYLVHTAKGDFAARCVVNAAGVYADQFNNMVSCISLPVKANIS